MLACVNIVTTIHASQLRQMNEQYGNLNPLNRMEIFNSQESYYLDDIQRIDFSVKLGQP